MLSLKMRKLVAITVMLWFGVALAAPLLGFDNTVPECCRRNGQHHCMGQMLPGPDSTVSVVSPKCPRFPAATVAPQPHSFLPEGTLSAGIPLFMHPASLPQTQARLCISFTRSRQKRGPPVLLF
jgi:hypothetical protein